MAKYPVCSTPDVRITDMSVHRPIRMFNRSKSFANKAKSLAKKKKQVQDFFSNPKNRKVIVNMRTLIG